MHAGEDGNKFCTDGVAGTLEDPLLTNIPSSWWTRRTNTLATDLLLGLLKKVQRARRDLRLIVSSATIQAEWLRVFRRGSDAGESGDEPSETSHHVRRRASIAC